MSGPVFTDERLRAIVETAQSNLAMCDASMGETKQALEVVRDLARHALDLRVALGALVEHVRRAAPTGWAAACDLDGAAHWERQASDVLAVADAALGREEA